MHALDPNPQPTTMSLPASVLRCCGATRGRCGYCKGENTSVSFGMWAVRLAARDYQELIDSGWRRSGHYIYRPDNARTCCPLYTIRLPADKFRPGKGHQRVLKRLRRHTVPDARSGGRGNDDRGDAKRKFDPMEAAAATAADKRGDEVRRKEAALNCVRRAMAGIQEGVPKEAVEKAAEKLRVNVWQERKVKKESKKKKRKLTAQVVEEASSPTGEKKDDPHFATNAVFVLAALERQLQCTPRPAQYAKEAKEKKKGRARVNCEPRQMEIGRIVLEQLRAVCADKAALLERVQLVSPGFINLWVGECIPDAGGVEPEAKEQDASISSPCGDTGRERGEKLASPAPSSEPAGFANGPFTQEFVPSRFDRESFEIFCRYQVSVHKDAADEWSERSYRAFLVDTPLRPEPSTSAVGSSDACLPLGSYHIRYRLNGVLFAVGVVDVLPSCLSSVYLFYDPAFSALSPGVLSALQEIAWVDAERARRPTLRHYYMGYYIHSCAKMRYKAAFVPSEMRCPETRVWVPAAQACGAIEAGGRPTRLAAADAQAAEDAGEHALSSAAASAEALKATVLIPGGERTRLADLRARLPVSAGRLLDGIQECIAAFVRRAGRVQSRAFVFDLSA